MKSGEAQANQLEVEQLESNKQNQKADEIRDAEQRDEKTQSQEAEDEQYLTVTGLKLFTLSAGLLLAIFCMTLSGSIVTTAIPRITSHFNSVADIGWYGSAYLLANCSLQPLTGEIYTYFPCRNTFVAFIVIFGIGSLVCGAATSSHMFIVGRALAGVGGSGMVNGAMSIIGAVVPLNMRPMLMGIGMSMTAIGSVIGPLVGGALTEGISWRWCFYINPPINAFTILVLFLVNIPDKRDPAKKALGILKILRSMDLIGFVLFAPTCIMALLALDWGGSTYAWSSATVIGLFCGSFGNLCVLAAWEQFRGDSAMIPLRILGKRVVIFGCWTCLLQFGALFVLTYYLPVWFQVLKKASPIESGIMMLPTMISQMISAPVTGFLVTKIGYYAPFAIFGGACTAIGGGLMSTFTPTTIVAQWIGYQILTGAGRGLAIQQPITAVQNHISEYDIPRGTALVILFQYLRGALFVSFGQTVFTNRLGPALKVFAPSIHPSTLIDAGATNIRDVVPASLLPGVLEAYNRALTQTFYLSAGAAAVAALTASGLGWKKIKRKAPRKEKTSKNNEQSVV